MQTKLLALSLAAGCAHVPGHPLAVPAGGTRIYVGEALGRDGTALFRYTRDSLVQDERWTSIHRSHDATTHELVVAQAARHDASYTLHSYVEHHRQLGIYSVVSASVPGRLEYTTHAGDRVRHRQERIDAPAVTGPTLFGFVTTHWERLERGEAIDIRFVVAERRRSYPFVLRMAAPARGRVAVQMRPRSVLLGLVISPMRMIYESETRTLLQYEGRIPPRKNGRPVDARVEYHHEAAFR